MGRSSHVRASVEDVGERVATALLASQWPRPMGADLYLTEECNHCCTYCFVHRKRPRSMTEEVLRHSVDFMLRSSPPGAAVVLLLFGGEPLICWDLVRLAVEYSRSRALQFGKRVDFEMTTNGTLPNEERARFLAAHGIRYLLSVDGAREDHDRHRRLVQGGSSYDMVMSAMPMLKGLQPWQGARMTVMPEGVGHVVENVDHLYRNGINQFIVGLATGVQWSDQALSLYEDQMMALADYYLERHRHRDPFRMTLYERSSYLKSYVGTWGCGAGRGRVCISIDGDLYGCGKMLGVDSPEHANRLGHIHSGFTEIALRAELLDNTDARRPKCQQCAYRDECAGGCPATNFEATGSVLDPDPLECRLIPLYVRLREKMAAVAAT